MADKIVQLTDKDGNDIFPVAVMPMLNYSMTEQNTGYKWIDGRDIYQKTVDTGQLPAANTTKNVAHNISNLRRVVKFEGCAFRSSNSTHAMLPFPSLNPIVVTADQTNIIITPTTDRTNFLESYITLYYTKSS